MAGGFLDLDKFTFQGRVVQAISELLMDETIKGPDINSVHTVFPDIVAHTEVGFIGKGGLIGQANSGCSPAPKPWKVNTRKLLWEPATWEVLLHLCWTELEQSAAVYALRTGVDIPDFSDTDYMNLVLQVLNESIMDFWWRLFWFNDTAADNVSSGGIITDGTDTSYFSMINGFWQQIYAQYASNPAQHAAIITENAGATYIAQRLDPDNIVKYFADVVFSAPIPLRKQSDRFLLVTQSVYDAYTQYLMNAHSLESARLMLMDGREALSYNGTPVIPNAKWDDIIETYEDTGTKLNNPHRIVFTAQSVLGVGVDNPDSFERLRIWYDPNTRLVKVEGMGRADAKLTNPDYFTVGI